MNRAAPEEQVRRVMEERDKMALELALLKHELVCHLRLKVYLLNLFKFQII